MKKVKITKILIQVGRENSGTVLGSIHGSFIFGVCVCVCACSSFQSFED